ncbi:TPA: toll/interleukin-1 receptor domain-containing protein [Proteus mirabilis]|uniref:toll/interleukin-1 receptor domain-containing protein n=1 Tax=Proteus mirabilis TaxID=584 RepID=UPI0008E99C05|nr:toll/interleukin-1 receptor domain-containing protein [Proteus mirabilis]EKY1726118.1 toll/interleukin-1 receptor domain-containing protein [Proteus mirabilis]ELA7948671.1 toll/interleukin-1 receptor domain-containing protein [Proteus mirabilis]MBG3017056.1 toll/interleukin-1 receptor domain-containing protein [Proteus mirabilis]MBG3049042.1 toll/interleukin-1 receptor domain-containing protein [Proteus mirabilis]MBI6269150.1 toll/interleukin-1 receptor domain-containing protein [Proteus mi
MHDSFISYAEEDNDFVSDVAFGLKRNGLSIWFAPMSLKVGERLLDSIEKGLNESRTGILVLSPAYLSKNWTSYEMDILIRQNIDGSKKILPIWFNVTKEDIDNKHIGLSGIVGITDVTDASKVVSRLVEVLSDGAPYRGVIPSWENPEYRFLNGLGEVNLQTIDGKTATIFELLIYSKDDQFPFWLAGKSYSKRELLMEVSRIIGADPTRVKKWVSDDGYKLLWDMCVENGLDPKIFY